MKIGIKILIIGFLFLAGCKNNTVNQYEDLYYIPESEYSECLVIYSDENDVIYIKEIICEKDKTNE